MDMIVALNRNADLYLRLAEQRVIAIDYQSIKFEQSKTQKYHVRSSRTWVEAGVCSPHCCDSTPLLRECLCINKMKRACTRGAAD